MPAPYLQRRGDTYSFRIAVPIDLRADIGAREITRTLKTPDRRIAIPRALHLASQALTQFAEIRAMPKSRRSELKFDLTLMVDFVMPCGTKATIKADCEPHEEEVAQRMIDNTIDRLTKSAAPIIKAPPAEPSPMLSAVIDDFIKSWDPSKKAMLTKHKSVMPLLLEIVGDKPVSELKQADIRSFFMILNRLPPYAVRKARSLKITLRELADLDHEKIIDGDSFRDTYKASIRLFLKHAQNAFHDQGFPMMLTADGCDYRGNEKETRRTQRAMRPHELKRLFEGPELQGYARKPEEVHRFWLPVLGLYTGARVNELCQINPQTDVFKDPATGIWCIQLTQDTEAGEDIEKSIKTDENRAVPMHRHLVELGFPDYCAAMKRAGAKQLFPAWAARGGRAAPNAIEWFSDFLKEIELHGVQNERGCVLLGMHAFRHTLLTYGRLQRLNLRCISGHADHSEGKKTAADGYEDVTILHSLPEKHRLLEGLDYGLSIPKPVLPRYLIR